VTLNVSAAVRDRYSEAAQERTADLCCAVNYDQKYLAAIPQEVLERDYGCGDPSKYVRPGDVVLDLGSGGGKICFIAAQVVGPSGRVIGVDCNDDMLALARRSQSEVARRVGYSNVEFRKGQIQDLKLDLDLLEAHLEKQPVSSSSDWLRVLEHTRETRHAAPMITDESVDVVVSNCVLNLVHSEERRQLFREIHRVLKPGGRAVISDIVADRDVPTALQNDPVLWSGCLSGAFREDLFLTAFEEAGFSGLEVLERQHQPWRVVEGIEFRSVTVRAHKLPVASAEFPDAATVMYRGPWKSVQDDAGRSFPRGARIDVDESTARTLQATPYTGQFLQLGDLNATDATNQTNSSCCLPVLDTLNGSAAAGTCGTGPCC
jgi:ubiquinone/menaquinone biosynthesis C-methylase UbiE